MKITILGGGTAGWLTALMVRQFYPHYDVQLIESDEIGILGAGEGTVPHFVSVMEFLNIPIGFLMSECKSTLKLGINFENWNGDNKSYFHTFDASPGVDGTNFTDYYFLSEITSIRQLSQSRSLDDISFQKKLCDVNKVPLIPKNSPTTQDLEPLKSLESHSTYAMHFDARELANFLRMIASGRNILRIEGKFKSANLNDKNDITSVVLEDGSEYQTDFIFDCSGFHRQILGKVYNTKWKSYKEFLPLNRAIPFFIEHDNNVSPKTDAIALKYGWMWRIPVQGRYGCGYVFDSNYISDEEAKQEVEEFLGHSITSPRAFSFDAGTFEETLVNNCMAVGLAQSFIEPLEATSIWVSCLNLVDFLRSNGVNNKLPQFKKNFNARCMTRNKNVVDFLALHYITDRNDSPFWQEFKDKCPPPSDVSDMIELMNHALVADGNLRDNIFSIKSWMAVAGGLGLIKPENLSKVIQAYNINTHLDDVILTLMKNQNSVIEGCITQKSFIDRHFN